MADESAPTVTDEPAESRYAVRVGDRVAGSAAYRRRGDVTTFTHTEVDEAYAGQGLGSVLVRAALDDVRSRGGTFRPLCPFVCSYVERHPEYADLMAARRGVPPPPVR